jgi:hypothetical protein
MDSKDRRKALLTSQTLNGIDFVEIANPEQTELKVHFLNGVAITGMPSDPPKITGGERIRSVAVKEVIGPSKDNNHQVLTLKVEAPGDFSTYTLTLQADNLDPFFEHAEFSFKARCPSDLDCKETIPPCPPVQADVPPIDYLAKDFLSFRQALLDFSSLRYPDWQERSEADFGVMFAEALSALADDLSYTQDRVAAEASLETATQRRSVVRHARLVDYEPRPATAATVMLQFDVEEGIKELPDGLVVTARGADGTSIPFETGGNLRDRVLDPESGARRSAPATSPTNAAWNAGVIKPYWFDDGERCLRAEATDMYVRGHGYKFFPGQPLLIETAGATTADPPMRQIVHLVKGIPATEICDPLFQLDVAANSRADPPYFTCVESPPAVTAPTAVTRIFWESADKLVADRDLTRTTLAGNLIPATQGLTLKATSPAQPLSELISESFVIPLLPPSQQDLPLALVRTGPNDKPDAPSLQYLYTLKQGPLAWLSQPDPADAPHPEIVLTDDEKVIWPFLCRLIDAKEFDNAFTLDAALYSTIALVGDPSVPSSQSRIVSSVQDYDGDAGDTIRFGDGTFGQTPLPGSRFDVIYRVGGGAIGNVAADAINQVDARETRVRRVTNPLPATDGSDPEPLDRVRRLAPEAFRAEQFRAVLPTDYQDAAKKKLPWVQKAGTVFRWTGSWLTVFTTADPLHSEEITVKERTEIINLLNRYRMAGYESYVPEAEYVSFDLVVELCARPDAFRGDVKEAVLTALSSKATAGVPAGFFDPDRFTFGQSLERSDLEGAIQNAAGVAGVTCVLYRIRNRTAGLAEMPDVVAVGTNEIIRCDNDPSFPEHGSLKITIRGGK